MGFTYAQGMSKSDLIGHHKIMVCDAMPQRVAELKKDHPEFEVYSDVEECITKADIVFIAVKPFHSEVFSINAGEQVNFEFEAKETRNYTMRTFGKMDTVMVLSEIVNGENVYLSGDDDSGEDRNSNIKIKMLKGKKYLINLKLYYKTSSGDTCLMLW